MAGFGIAGAGLVLVFWGAAEAPPLVVSAEGEAAAGTRLVGRRWAWAGRPTAIASNTSSIINEHRRNISFKGIGKLLK